MITDFINLIVSINIKLSLRLLCQGFAPHISPFAQMRDCGNLLTRAGFNLTTVVSMYEKSKEYMFYEIVRNICTIVDESFPRKP